jgi:ankyrin repeat protein
MEDIFEAAGEGNEEEVRRLLDADPALLGRGCDDGENLLALAAANGHLRVVRLLIERGVNISATGDGGNTALHYAAEQGYEEVVALLLDKGAHGNTRNQLGVTPLMWACEGGHLGVVKMLVQHRQGQGLQKRSGRGWTALHWAAYAGNQEVERFLLLAGADPTITDNEGRTPFALAEENHYYQIFVEGRARCVAMFQVRPLAC